MVYIMGIMIKIAQKSKGQEAREFQGNLQLVIPRKVPIGLQGEQQHLFSLAFKSTFQLTPKNLLVAFKP
jgi:hypothetical protein